MIRAIRSGLAVAAPPDGGRYAYRIDGDMRVVQVPSDAAVLGVEGDRNTNRVAFFLPREYRGTDLSEFDVQVSYVNAGGELGVYDAGKPTVEADGLSFDWLVEEPVVRYQGAVRFAAKLYQADERGAITRQYSTTVGTATCLEGLDVDAELPEDVTKSLLAQLTGLTEASAKRANEAASRAEAAADGANEAASRAAGNILRAEASGALCHADDAFRAKPLGLTVYGASVQDGTPSPDSPKPIASVTQADMSVCGKNLVRNVYGKALVSNGVAFTPLADGGIRAEGTSAGGGAYYNFDFATGVRHLRGRTITMNGTGGGAACWSFGVFNEDGTYPVLGASHGTGATFEVPEGAERCRCFIAVPDGATANETVYPMACIGAKAGGYEPYVSASFPIDLQGHELRGLPNGVRDEVRIDSAGNVELVKRVGICPMPKAESISDGQSQSGADGTKNYVVSFSPPANAASGNGASCVCTHFADGGTTKNRDTIRFGANDSHVYVYTIDADVIGDGTKEAVDAWMAANGVKLLYPLAEPETVPLGKVELPALPAPVCNAWVESDVPTECSVRYVRDVNIVIEKLEKQLAAVAGAVSMLDTPTVIPELAE